MAIEPKKPKKVTTLSDTLAEIKKGVIDILTLDVVTLTGEITVTTDANGNIDLSEIYKAIEEQAKTAGALEVIAFTHLSTDMDTVQFVKKNLGESEKALHEAHVATLATSIEARNAMVRTIKDVIDL